MRGSRGGIIDELQIEMLQQNIETFFITITTLQSFLIQLGFTLFEVGGVRGKNTYSTLYKNCLDICINGVCFWTVGYGLAFGEDTHQFIGTDQFAIGINGVDDHLQFRDWQVQWVFALTSSKIISGCVAERIRLEGYILFSAFYTIWIYPVVAHSCWGGGYLQNIGFKDQTGSTVVYLTGGVSGLIAAKLLGPRLRIFDKNVDPMEYKPQSIPYNVLGAIILWFSFHKLNLLQQTNHSPNPKMLLAISINTLFSAIAALCTSSMITLSQSYFNPSCKNHKFLVTKVYQALLSGVVGISAQCSTVKYYDAFCIGCLCSLIYTFMTFIINWLKYDDPLNGASIFFGGGLTGSLSVGLFDHQEGILYGSAGNQFGIQLLSVGAIILWVSINSIMFLSLLKLFDLLVEDNFAQTHGTDKMYFGASTSSLDIVTYKILQVIKTQLEQQNNSALPKLSSHDIVIESENQFYQPRQQSIVE